MREPHTVDYHESFGGLLRGILFDLRQLMREELELARVELREQATRAKVACVSLAGAVMALAIGGVFLLIAIATGIADAFNWPLWAGYLLVAGALGTFGVVMLTVGRNRLRHVHAVPEEAVRTLKENSAWIARRLTSEQK